MGQCPPLIHSVHQRDDGALLQQLHNDLLGIITTILGKNLGDEEKTQPETAFQSPREKGGNLTS